MFTSFLQVHTEIRTLLTAPDIIARFDRINITTLEMVIPFLEVFKDISVELESDKEITSVKILPAYETIIKHIEPTPNDSTIVKKMKSRAKIYIEQNMKEILPAKYQLWAFFNPKYKRLQSFKSIDKSTVVQQIEFEIDLMGNSSTNDSMGNASNTQVNDGELVIQQASSRSKEHTKRSVFDVFQDHIETVNDSISEEIERYMNSKNGNVINLLDWWFTHKEIYPNLYRYFLQIAAIPATSASAERLFSDAGNVITDKRSQLLPKNVEFLVFLHRNKLL